MVPLGKKVDKKFFSCTIYAHLYLCWSDSNIFKAKMRQWHFFLTYQAIGNLRNDSLKATAYYQSPPPPHLPWKASEQFSGIDYIIYTGMMQIFLRPYNELMNTTDVHCIYWSLPMILIN